MANRDSAFLWETEVLRSARRASHAKDSDEHRIENGGDWLTIREASEAIGVPTSTIRKWARHDNIPSQLEETEEGHVRIVSMEGIRRWTDEIGRDIDKSAVATKDGSEVDLTLEEVAAGTPAIPEGSMLVPLDAWNKMLNQLGNLHEAGQQLAEARERAAKAETEARFLRERLRELREDREHQGEPATPSQPEPPAVEPSRSATSWIRRMYSDWRRNRRS